MGDMVSQITGNFTVYATACSDRQQQKIPKFHSMMENNGDRWIPQKVSVWQKAFPGHVVTI